MRRTALAALCLVAVTGAGLTGCQSGGDTASAGSQPASEQAKDPKNSKDSKDTKDTKEPFAGLSGGEITERALAATTGAPSLRFTGEIPDEESGGTLRLDLALDKKGDCAGTLGLGDEGEVELIKTGGTLYAKYDEAFLRAQSEGEPQADVDAVVEMMAGTWTKMAATGADAEDIAGFCDLDEVLGDAGSGSSDATRGKATTLDGTGADAHRAGRQGPVHLLRRHRGRAVSAPAGEHVGRGPGVDHLHRLREAGPGREARGRDPRPGRPGLTARHRGRRVPTSGGASGFRPRTAPAWSPCPPSSRASRTSRRPGRSGRRRRSGCPCWAGARTPVRSRSWRSWRFRRPGAG